MSIFSVIHHIVIYLWNRFPGLKGKIYSLLRNAFNNELLPPNLFSGLSQLIMINSDSNDAGSSQSYGRRWGGHTRAFLDEKNEKRPI